MKLTKLTLFLLTFFTFNLTAQKLDVVRSKCYHNGIMIDRTVENLITLLELSNSEFESEMKNVGNNTAYGDGFSILAYEQISSYAAEVNGGKLSGVCNVFSYEKQDRGVVITWLGEHSHSGIKSLVSLLEPYYVGTKNDTKSYSITKEEKQIGFVVSREHQGGKMYSESIVIFYTDEISK